MSDPDVLIVGAGLAGLACARALAVAGLTPLLLEADDVPGGRVRTDRIDGFLCDRGFQVLLTAYAEVPHVVPMDALDLRRLEPGARIRLGEGWADLGDPLRRPSALLPTLRAPVGTLGDKVGILRWRADVGRGLPDSLLTREPDATTAAWLAGRRGFSPRMIDTFLRPFLAGIFLDPTLGTSRRMADWVWRMFSAGHAAIPAQGMGELPRQMAAALPEGALQTGVRVHALTRDSVTLGDGTRLQARAVVLATDMDTTARLLGDRAPARPWCGTTCFYFDAPEDPVGRPLLVLNGTGQGPINSLHAVSAVQPAAAPAGRTLMSVSVVGPPPADGGGLVALRAAVVDQLVAWYGARARDWRPVHHCAIPRALPAQAPGMLPPSLRAVGHPSGVFLAGDWLETASIQGALVSGRNAALAVIDQVTR
jgi:phytoene dehydrogenase-like protein